MEGGKKESLRDLKYLMVVSGQWMDYEKHPKVKMYLQKVRSWFFISVWPLIAVSIYLGGFKDNPSTVGMTSAGLLICFQSYLYAFNWAKTKRIVSAMETITEQRDLDWEIEIIAKESTKCWTIVNYYKVYTVVLSVLGVIVPYLVDYYLYWIGSKKPFAVMTLFVIDAGEERSFKFYASNAITSFWFFQYMITLYGFESFNYIAITNICIEMDIMKKHLAKWKENRNETLKSFVDQHSNIMKLSWDLKELMGLPFLAQTVLGALACTFHMYTAISNIHTDLVLAGMNIFLYFLGNNVMFFTSRMGQRLQDESLSIMDALYDLPWYEMSLEERKNMIMILRRSHKPMIINYLGIGNLNHLGFMNMLHASYSYFMVVSSKI